MKSICEGRFTVQQKMHGNANSEVYDGIETKYDRKIAIKTESNGSRIQYIPFEAKIYKVLAGGTGIPALRWFGTSNGQNVLIMDKLGSNLEQIFENTKKNLTFITVSKIATQMLERLEYLHSKHLIHRDIKPSNVLVGKGANKNIFYLIDFGFAKKFRDPKTLEHIPYREGKNVIGTPRFMSIRAHKGIEQSRRDDLESLAYSLIYLSKGFLPWMDRDTDLFDTSPPSIMLAKESLTPENLCVGLPEPIFNLLSCAKSLEFDQVPPYSSLRKGFYQYIMDHNIQYDYDYEWEKERSKQSLVEMSIIQNVPNKVISAPNWVGLK